MVRAPATDDAPAIGRACGPLALVLALCAAACGVLVAARWAVGGRLVYLFLPWNLFLAGLPFAFALLASVAHERLAAGRARTMVLGSLVALWLLFFPNAPYLVTDLVHLHAGVGGAPRWYDAVLFGAFAATGVAAGLASLLLVHGLVVRRRGALAGWLVVVAASSLGGFGVCIGRFARLNSWDVLVRPGRLLLTLLDPLLDPAAHQRTLVASALYGGFILLGYLAVAAMLHAGRHLHSVAAPAR
jgi:uncharacterized membrane protein